MSKKPAMVSDSFIHFELCIPKYRYSSYFNKNHKITRKKSHNYLDLVQGGNSSVNVVASNALSHNRVSVP